MQQPDSLQSLKKDRLTLWIGVCKPMQKGAENAENAEKS